MPAGAYTSVPDVIDYLMATITALPECASPVQVTDGFPGTFQSQQMVCVGGGPDDDEQSALRDYVVLGTGPQAREEDYEVVLYLRCWAGGDLAQKPVRDQVFVIYKAIEAAVNLDKNLGGNISKHYPARLGGMNLIQTKADGARAGRVAEIRCTVNVKHRY